MPPETPMPCRTKLIECVAPDLSGREASSVTGEGAVLIYALPLVTAYMRWFRKTPEEVCRDLATRIFSKKSLPFAEIVSDQRDDRVHRLFLVGAVGFERHAAPLARREHHHSHDALCIYLAAV